MKVTVKVPGTCGELVQGIIKGRNFHITCPIDLHSQVTVKRDDSSAEIKMNQQQDKILSAVSRTLDYFGYQELGLEVSRQSDLIAEKGMASSTADIVGGIVATSRVLGEEITEELIKKLALAIEPTDGLFFPGIVDFDHLQGQHLVELGSIPPIPLLVFDIGGTINTEQFNLRPDLRELKRAKEEQVRKAYQLVAQGIKEADLGLIGRGATISTAANQAILRKPGLDRLLKLAESKPEIVGVNAAHSGTLVGVMVTEEQKLARVANQVQISCPELDYLFTTRLINGGYQVLEEE